MPPAATVSASSSFARSRTPDSRENDFRSMTGLDVRPVVATRADVLAAIDRYYRADADLDDLTSALDVRQDEDAHGDHDGELGTRERDPEAGADPGQLGFGLGGARLMRADEVGGHDGSSQA